jgi:ATP-dependent protease HslVU (ClpYQ) peptidase subunit
VWKPPAIPANIKDEYHFMITTVVPSMRDCIKESGYTPTKDDEDAGFEFLLAINGTIYQVDDNYSVYLRDDGLYGVGSGSSWALGALAGGATWKQAMQIAARNDVYTAPPFITHRQEKK